MEKELGCRRRVQTEKEELVWRKKSSDEEIRAQIEKEELGWRNMGSDRERRAHTEKDEVRHPVPTLRSYPIIH